MSIIGDVFMVTLISFLVIMLVGVWALGGFKDDATEEEEL